MMPDERLRIGADRGATLRRRARAAVPLLAALLLAACASAPAPRVRRRPPQVVRAEIERLMPAGVHDRKGWATDIYAAFASQHLPATTSNLCSVLAVTAQESGFEVHPVIPHLPRIARRTIDKRAAEHHVPRFLVDAALWIRSPDGRRYSERLKHVRTEQQLSEMFQDFIGMVPLGKRLFGDLNPVRTGGPMQVSVVFSEAHDNDYPYPVHGSIRHEVFTRRGGLYFGILHLLAYPVSYPRPLYRFADYNAGWYASRNAAFQHAVTVASGIPLKLDGDLVRYGSDTPGATERAVDTLAGQIGVDKGDIHDALAKGETPGFAQSRVYRRVFALAEKLGRKPLPRAMLPGITLESPKITRHLTTAWFARRVDGRWKRCMARARGH